MNIQWSLNGMEWCVDPMLELPFPGFGDKISENGRNIYEWNQRSARMEETSMNEIKSIKQYSKLISIEQIEMKTRVWHFEDLEYLNTINVQYSKILFNVTERGFLKLHPSELSMDIRFGRSTFDHFESFHYYFALSMNRMNHVFP